MYRESQSELFLLSLRLSIFLSGSLRAFFGYFNCLFHFLNFCFIFRTKMRKNFIAIFVLLVFLNFQFGKMVNYVHCKWQTSWIQPDCDCNKILTDHFGDDASPGAIDKEGLKQIPSEFQTRLITLPSCISYSLDISFLNAYNSIILEPYMAPAFHPPNTRKS